MARMRMVKPEMRKSLTVSSWPVPVRWTFVGLLGYVDDFGRGVDELRLVKAELYPLDDDMTAKKIDAHLAMMVERGPLCRYVVDGMAYLHFATWAEHQKVSHPSPSRIPPCPVHDKDRNDSGAAPEDSGEIREGSGNVPPRVRAGARGSGIREQGSGIAPERTAPEGKPPPPPTGRPRDDLFDALVAACEIDPAGLTKVGRGQVNAALGQLREVAATSGQITLRARNFRQRYPSISLTPSALAKHWASLGAGRESYDEAAWAKS